MTSLNTRDDNTFTPDDHGREFDGLAAAKSEAARALAELTKEVLPGVIRREIAIEVRDEDKIALFRTALVFYAARLRPVVRGGNVGK